MKLTKKPNLYDLGFYCKERFFIFPFCCDKCKNIFALEHGMKVYRMPKKYSKEEYWTYDIDERRKYCSICAKEEEKEMLDALEEWTKADEKIENLDVKFEQLMKSLNAWK